MTSETPRITSNRERRNIGNFFTKLGRSNPVTVAYLGGSITAGTGASNPDKSSFRPLVTQWIRQKYSAVEVEEINAGIAGTGSLYGTMRVRRDVLAFKPDLVFVEFSVEDAGEDDTAVKKAVEGLLRQLLVVPQPPEVVMLYASSTDRNSYANRHDLIAAHYGIPALNLEQMVWELIDQDKIKPAEFWGRGFNPSDLGHKFYADRIIEFLEAQMKLTPTPIERSLPLPIISDELNYGEFKAVAEIWHDSNWRTESNIDRRLPTKLLVTNKPGAQIEYYFEGTVIGLTYRKGPDCGSLEVLIDGKSAPQPLNKIDCYSIRRQIGTSIISGGLGPGEHKLTIRVLNEKNAGSSGFYVRLGYLLIGGQRPEKL